MLYCAFKMFVTTVEFAAAMAAKEVMPIDEKCPSQMEEKGTVVPKLVHGIQFEQPRAAGTGSIVKLKLGTAVTLAKLYVPVVEL